MNDDRKLDLTGKGSGMDTDHYALAYMSHDRSPHALGNSHGPPDAGMAVNIHMLQRLSAAELNEIRKDTYSILGFFSSQHILCALELNLADLRRAGKTYLGTFDHPQPIAVATLVDASANFHRHLLSLLSVFRSFLQHNDVRMKQHYGRKSSEKIEWEKVSTAFYDHGSFAYRLMLSLRNYAQHVHIPRVTASLSLGESGHLELDRDELLAGLSSEHPWQSLLRNELATRPLKIPLVPLLDEWWNDVGKLSRRLAQIEIRFMEEAACRTLRWRTLHSLPGPGDFCIVKEPPPPDPDGHVEVSVEWLPEREATVVLAMASQHRQHDRGRSAQNP